MKRLYNTKAWYRLRWRQLQAEPLCRFCQQQGKVVAAAVVDHIKPHKGDEDLFYNAENLQSLCKQCHDGAKAKAEARGVAAVGCDTTGVPIDPAHHWHKV